MTDPRQLNDKHERTVRQEDRPLLLAHPEALAYRKRSRILAIQMQAAFRVETDRGPMVGQPGDFLVTNHPDDDPGSDLWTVSAERMAATYDLVDEDVRYTPRGPERRDLHWIDEEPSERFAPDEEGLRLHAQAGCYCAGRPQCVPHGRASWGGCMSHLHYPELNGRMEPFNTTVADGTKGMERGR